MKKIISFILIYAVIFTNFMAVVSAQGITEKEVEALIYANPLSKSAKKEKYINLKEHDLYDDNGNVTGVYTIGEDLDADKSFVVYLIEEDNYSDLFTNYKSGHLTNEFAKDKYGWYCLDKETKDLLHTMDNALGYPRITEAFILEQNQKNIFDFKAIAQIINNANIGTVSEMEIFRLMSVMPDLYIYVKTDKGEYVMPTLKNKDIDNYALNLGKEVKFIECMKIYTADEIVALHKEFISNFYELAEATKNGENVVRKIDEKGEEIVVTSQEENAVKTVPTKITLTDFFDSSAGRTERITIHKVDGKLTGKIIIDGDDIKRFYELSDETVMTKQDKTKTAPHDGGAYIEVLKTNGDGEPSEIAFAFISKNGEVDKYSMFMSRNPMAQYIIDDAQKAQNLVDFLWDNGSPYIQGEESVKDSVESKDLPSEWSKEYVRKAIELNIVSDLLQQKYQENISREEFCELAFAILEKATILKTQIESVVMPFTDTSNISVFTLWSKGIINGKSEIEFAPNDLLTREEAVTISNRIANYLNVQIPTLSDFNYADTSEISDWARESARQMFSANIMKGVGENKFAPKDNYTKEQAIVTMMRIFNKAQDVKVTTFADSLNRLMPTDKNYMFSPLSIKMALAMAAVGAEGETKDEILKVLQIEDLEKFNQFAKQLIKEYSENEKVKLNIANSLWLNTDYYKDVDFEDVFKSTVANNYDAYSEKVNNANAVEKINNWVNDKTNGKITKLVSDNDFLAYIVNAIYFKGEWAVQFSEGATKKSNFTDRNNNKNEIDFMNKTGYFDYYEDKYVQMLRLPYKDRKTSMYIAIPAGRTADLDENIEKMESKRVQISLPKFKTEFSVELIDTLSQMGIHTAFNPNKADFKNMYTDTPENIFISDVIHKTFINVDENGTEAAAVTGVGAGGGGMPTEPPIVFNANKPFTYFVRDDINGEILFMGEYAYVE